MKKKTGLISMALAVAMVMSLTVYGQNGEASTEAESVISEGREIIHYPDPGIKENLPEEKPSEKEDFYLNINYEEIKDTEIPEGKSNYDAFSKLGDEVRENMLKTLESGNIDSKDTLALSYYQKYVDTNARDAAGWTSVMPLIERIRNIRSADQLYTALCEPELDAIANVFTVRVDADEKNSKYNVIYYSVMNLSLQDSAEYSELTDMGKRYQDANEVYYTDLLKKCGYTDDEAKAVLAGRYDFESAMAKHMLTREDSYKEDYNEKTYNAFSEEELIELFGNIPIKDLIEKYGADEQEKYVVTEPEFFKALSEYITDDTIENVKGYIICSILNFAAKVSDTQSHDLYNTWQNAVNGSTGELSVSEQAYNITRKYLPELTGDIYAGNFCSEKTKKDIEGDVTRILEVMRERIQSADWMSDETKKSALGKIDTMGVYIAYPEAFLFDYDKITIDDKDLFAATQAILVSETEQLYATAGKEINRAAWGRMMSADTVNAGYYPPTNSIYFPAAILQPPFYDANASVSARLGAIEVVIGHEITHAFDRNGSQFDQDGNMVNWWTDEDREAFSDRIAKLEELYASYATVDDQCVNGEFTVGENTADLGGVSMCLEVLEKMENEGEEVNYKEFFEAYAKIWFRILIKENAEYRLKTDPHAPNSLRTNLIVRQFEKFYETYGIEEGDTMYTAPNDRIAVW